MSDTHAAYVAFLSQYASTLEEMCEQTQKRYNALVSFDAAQLGHAMASLQSAIMQIDQMETKRMSLAEEAGYGGLTFAQTLEKAADEDRETLRALMNRIVLAVSNIKFTNEKSIEFAKEGLASLTPEALGETKNLYEPPARGKQQKAAQTAAVFDAKY